ncbi:enoyl-CoA hydratase/isomerase [Thermoflavimicrobium dichotomicum]|uniref:Polyketide biosynthesis enoyl-CoA hydratase PksH n=1 Tax=Thermoflavimicrobium dichotomicum TaxID=46223 RepID=A0A1I3VB25_9BACL|nr:enoyl-CoA hydratase/isomerase [Thermoflavimicrobium dichotomicum]SFJ92568.1 polyketide biosynthesis enoyl-CoA hydratase PksH [Thermoflavimicrobium dichotomicum]
MTYQTIEVRIQEPVCFIRFNRAEAKNTVNDRLIDEFHQVLDVCEQSQTITIVVLEGSPDVFCFGADFEELRMKMTSGKPGAYTPEPTYDLWLRLASGPFITISHVRGRANAGGVGFVAASDIVIASQTAQFSLSELLFGLYPACVLPFLIRRVGFQRAHYMSLITQPISVQQAYMWGLVDAYDDQSESLLHRHLLRLRRLPRTGILRYKRYISELNDSIRTFKTLAVSSNQEVFSDPANLERIFRFIETGQFSSNDR